MLGINGAREDALRGKTVVLTGLFPELGGGSGLDLGKERAKAMVEEFGGKVRARRSLVTVDRVLTVAWQSLPPSISPGRRHSCVVFRYTGNIERFRTDGCVALRQGTRLCEGEQSSHDSKVQADDPHGPQVWYRGT